MKASSMYPPYGEKARVGEGGRKLIKRFEGLRLSAYHDSAGVKTIGWGHTGELEKNVITLEEAEELFEKDLAHALKAVEDSVTVPLNQYQLDALVSFVFNVGRNKFRKSSVLKYVNDAQFEKAMDVLEQYVYAGGDQLVGLVRRRSAERVLFETVQAPTFVTTYQLIYFPEKNEEGDGA